MYFHINTYVYHPKMERSVLSTCNKRNRSKPSDINKHVHHFHSVIKIKHQNIYLLYTKTVT